MASSRKTTEEKEKKKNKVKVKAKETKPTKTETKKKANPSPKKTKNNNKKKTGIQNGTVSESEDEVAITTPATSSDNDSETEQDIKSRKKMQQDDDEDVKEDTKVCNFPMNRVKRIFKTQSSDFSFTGEAVFLVNKATDKFLEQFCEDAYECCAKDDKKSLAYKHLASVVSKQRRYEFLSDFVPEKIKAEEALAQRKLAEEGEELNP